MTVSFFSLPNSEPLDRLGEDITVPDVILPEIYFENLRPSLECQPERKLMLAVLEATVSTYRDKLIRMAKSTKGPRRNTRHFRMPNQKIEKNILECEEWFQNTDCIWPYSFENICNALDLSPEYLRSGLAKSKKDILNMNSKALNALHLKRHRSNNQSGIGRHSIG